MAYILFRSLHFIAIIALAGALVVENLAVERQISGDDARNLARVDAVYGVSAVLVLFFGLALWLWVGKPAEFYSGNPLFQIKLGLFVLVALLSVYPTVFLLRHRNSMADSIAVPVAVIRLVRLELVVLALIPILAFLVARGVGLGN